MCIFGFRLKMMCVLLKRQSGRRSLLNLKKSRKAFLFFYIQITRFSLWREWESIYFMIKFIAPRKRSKQLRMDQAARMDAVQSQKRVNEGLFILNNGFHVFAPESHCLRCNTTIYPLRASTQCTSSPLCPRITLRPLVRVEMILRRPLLKFKPWTLWIVNNLWSAVHFRWLCRHLLISFGLCCSKVIGHSAASHFRCLSHA